MQRKDIEHIASLARLELTEEEFERYGKQLSNILKFIEQLSEVDTEGVEPTAQVTGLENSLRDDEMEEWNPEERDAALDLAPEREERFVKTKRVLG